MSRRPIDLSVFLPAFDEAPNLERTVDRVRAALDALPVARREVIVVDDGSTDGTAAIADGLSERHADVRAVHHDANRGYGGALRTGFAESRLEWVFFTDADGQFDPRELRWLIDATDRFDVVVGYRVARADPVARRGYAPAWGALVGALVCLGSHDVHRAVKLLRR